MSKEKRLFSKEMFKRIIAIVILIAVLLVSIFCISDIASNPENYKKSIATLDEKKITVTELTGAITTSSVVISLIPGDSTTAIAGQIAELSTYLMLVLGVIMLEKVLITLTGHIAFTYLIPIACTLAIAFIVSKKDFLKTWAIKISMFAIIICLIIPSSIAISNKIENIFETTATIEAAEKQTAEIESESAETDTEEKTGIKGWFSNTIETVTNGLKNTKESVIKKAEDALSKFVDAVAVFVITSFVIPLLVLISFVLLTKAIFSSLSKNDITKSINKLSNSMKAYNDNFSEKFKEFANK